MIWLALVATVVFAVTHLFAGKMRFLTMLPRSRWLSFAGGVSVAYVFVHLLPEAAHLAGRFEDQRWLYLLALAGVTVFYGLERWVVKRQGGRDANDTATEQTPATMFWIHVGSYATYNALACYLLVREAEYEPGGLALFTVAIALHFIVNDFALQEHHRDLYHDRGRYVLAAATFVGWGVGVLLPVSGVVTSALFGFLCGSIVMNVLKEELPAERESRFGAFLLGTAGFAALLFFLPVADAGHAAAEQGQHDSSDAAGAH